MAATTEPVPATKKAMTVVATKPGLYPMPGETYAVYRDVGAVFTLNDPEHFADEDVHTHGWMRLATPEAIAAAQANAPAKQVPQTAARGQKVRPGF